MRRGPHEASQALKVVRGGGKDRVELAGIEEDHLEHGLVIRVDGWVLELVQTQDSARQILLTVGLTELANPLDLPALARGRAVRASAKHHSNRKGRVKCVRADATGAAVPVRSAARTRRQQ